MLEASKVGVYIGPDRVHVAQVARGLAGARLVRAAEAEIRDAAPGAPPSPEAVADAVRRALQNAGIRARRVTAALTGMEAIVRRFDMPLLPKKEWAEAVRFEAQRYVPFDIRAMAYDAEVLPDRIGRRMSVLFAGARREAVAALLEQLRQAGLEGEAVEPAAQALARALLLKQPAKPAGKIRALVAVSADGRVDVILARDHGALLVHETVLGAPGQEPGAGGGLAELLLQELRLVFGAFTRRFKGEPITQVLLCAEPPAAGAETLLQRELGLPVLPADPVRALGGRRPCTAGIACAIGLVLPVGKMASGRPGRALNLAGAERNGAEAPKRLPREEEQRLITRWGGFGLAGAALVIAVQMLPVQQRIAGTQRAVNTIVQGHPAPKAVMSTAPVADAETAQAALQKEFDFLATMVDRRVYVTKKLGELVRLVPDGTWLTGLEYADEWGEGGRWLRSLRLNGAVLPGNGGDEVASINRFSDTLNRSPVMMEGLDRLGIGPIRKSVVNATMVTSFSILATTVDKASGAPDR